MLYVMIWVGSIQGYRDVKFTKPYATAFVLCFKEEKKESFSQGKTFAVSGARLDRFGSEIGYGLAV